VTKTIQVRDVPDDVHTELRARAAAAGTSLSDYVRSELERVARRSNNAEVLLRAAQRDWSVTRVATRELLDEARAER
jgi:plasmid stability protein